MYTDESLTCTDCNAQFTFSAGEQEFFAAKGFQNKPNRCPDCRAARKAQRSSGGGGGGYSGGGGGVNEGGGGGGSYAASVLTVTSSQAGENSGEGEVTIDGVSVGTVGSIVTYTTTDASFDIVAYGAQGGGSFRFAGSPGAEFGGDVTLPIGTVLDILVGQAGGSGSIAGLGGGGGGGGSFVWIVSEPAVVPEPSTWAMMLVGFAGLGFAGYRRTRKTVSIAA